MDDYKKRSIVRHAWHEFLYGYNNEERKAFLESMCEMYPIKMNSDEPSAIYIKKYSLPLIEPIEEHDIFQELFIAREYLNIAIVKEIIKRAISCVGTELLEKDNSFIENANRLRICKRKIQTLQEFLASLEESLEFYKASYQDLLVKGQLTRTIDDVNVPFIELTIFAKYFKRYIGMQSHFAVIIDHQESGALISQKAVNSIINRRITGDFSMKVACTPEDWQTYYDLNGRIIENVHDYSVVELDDSYDKYSQKLRKKYQI